jgi:hypothetical protein
VSGEEYNDVSTGWGSVYGCVKWVGVCVGTYVITCQLGVYGHVKGVGMRVWMCQMGGRVCHVSNGWESISGHVNGVGECLITCQVGGGACMNMSNQWGSV